jgi:hypothetical protein
MKIVYTVCMTFNKVADSQTTKRCRELNWSTEPSLLLLKARARQGTVDEILLFRHDRPGFTPEKTPPSPRSRHPRSSNLWEYGGS